MKIHVDQREGLGLDLGAQPVQSQAKEIPLLCLRFLPRTPAHHLAVLWHGATDDPASATRIQERDDVFTDLVAADALLRHGLEVTAIQVVPLWVLQLSNQLDAGQVAHLQDVLPVQNFGKIYCLLGVATSEIWSTVIFAATRLAKD